jgi:alkanesulfonate monooxygenase SsuD/methylene tetrahydromethanopterin reductase-like flavin-dependent oxidoreductase (luciferase family)
MAVSRIDVPVHRSQLPLFNDNPFKLGIFCLNVSHGTTMTTAPGTLTPTWDQTVRIAQAADRAGWEFLLPLGRWRGSGGRLVNMSDRSFEVYTWAAGIAALTEHIQIFTTSHLRMLHPIIAAKQGATLDHVARGRSALNVVAGQKADEVAMFGIEQVEHDEGYEIADEWTTILKRLYTEDEEFDFAGRFYKLKRARISPKPLQQPYPVIVNAGMSPAGRRFGAKHADLTFVNEPDLEKLKALLAEIRDMARREFGREEMGMLNHAWVVCRDTEKEARDYERYCIDEHGDWEAAQAFVDVTLRGRAQSLSPEYIQGTKRSFIAGFNAIPLVGTPEQVVDRLLALQKAGITGTALHWVDYEAGIEYFNARVLPLMVQAGLRKR